MKLSSVTAVALLSGLSLAAPREPACGAAITVTVTSTVTNQAAGGGGVAGIAGGATITVTAPGSSAPTPDTNSNNNAPGNTDPKGLEQPHNDNGGSNGGNGGNGGDSGNGGAPAPTPAGPNDAMVTEYNKGGDGKQTVRACPTGQDNYDCFEAVYGNDGKMSTVNIINISVTTINGETTTKTVTKNGGAPQITPGPEPKINRVGDDGDSDKTVTVDMTVTSTKNGKTVLKTSTHTTVVRGAGTGTATNSKPTHVVKVGESGKMEFQPSNIKANKGDLVRFRFFPKSHSVTSCSVEDPCIWDKSFDSGFKFTAITNSTQFIDYPITNEKPLHFFSKQKGECKQGMVFAINPSSEKSFSDFLSRAKSFDEKKLLSQNSTLNSTEAHGWNATRHNQKFNDNGTAPWNLTHHRSHFNDTKNETAPWNATHHGLHFNDKKNDTAPWNATKHHLENEKHLNKTNNGTAAWNVTQHRLENEKLKHLNETKNGTDAWNATQHRLENEKLKHLNETKNGTAAWNATQHRLENEKLKHLNETKNSTSTTTSASKTSSSTSSSHSSSSTHSTNATSTSSSASKTSSSTSTSSSSGGPKPTPGKSFGGRSMPVSLEEREENREQENKKWFAWSG